MRKYKLFVSFDKDEQGKFCKCYGVKYGGTVIEDITFSKEKITPLIKTMNELVLEPVHLFDVIQDFL